MSNCKEEDVGIFELYLYDLTEHAKKRLAEAMGISVSDLEKETNWDIFPIAEVIYPIVKEGD